MRNLGCRLGKADGFADLLDSSKVFTVQSDQIGSDDQKRRVDRIIDAQPGGLPSIREILELDERVHHDRWLAARKNLEAAAAAAGSPLPPHEGSKPFEQLSSHQRWVSQFQSLMNCVTLARLSENAYALIRSVAQAKLREALVRALDQKLAEVKNPDSPYFPFDGKLLSLCDIRNAIAAKEWGPLAEEQAPVWWELLLGRSKAPAPKSRSD
jgi:hypothetical protein